VSKDSTVITERAGKATTKGERKAAKREALQARKAEERKKRKKRKGGKRPSTPPPFTAATADKYELYQLAVQSADLDVKFLDSTYRSIRGQGPRHLREDFCGTSLLCCEWVKLGAEYTAEGYDLDPEPLEWGRENNHSKIGADAERIELHLADAREEGERLADVRIAQNFSYWIFRERAELLDYFRRARAGLGDDGIFVIDLYGGTESNEEMTEDRKIEEGFTYIWDQDCYYPGSGEFRCFIHFHFRDGSKMKRAFAYEWRFWNLPELKDLLREAGFSKVTPYFEGEDPDDPEEGNGEFSPDERGENCESWIAYLVSEK
jgi:hypothetical protein